MNSGFPQDFLWGVATSAYQVEGSPLADGAGPSIWHRFSHTPGKVWGGDTGDVACDHYRRMAGDVALMRALGLRAYRFSIAWARVFPEGRGRCNPRGLDFYRRLIDRLNDAGLTPFVTLYHWDLPDALEALGGWTQRDSAAWFGDFAHFIFRELGDGVRFWTTLNEPWVVMHEGHLTGSHAPGRSSLQDAAAATHNLLRAHATAVQAHRADGHGQIGLVVNLEPKHAVDESEIHQNAARRADAYMNRQFLDPLFLGRYPDELLALWGDARPPIFDEDWALLAEPCDFLGINYYTRSVVRHAADASPFDHAVECQRSAEHTQMAWEVYPDGLCEVLEQVRQRYGDIPLFVTENGAAFDDPPERAGRINDARRVAYLEQHVAAVRQAIRKGVDVRGYFAWSLFDNFEWGFGYARTFGLVHVDRATQRRTPKASALRYREIIAANGLEL